MAEPFRPCPPDPVPADQMLLLGRPFTRAAAAAAGISPKVLRRMVRQGEVRAVLRGVYVDSAAVDDLTLRTQAVATVLPDHAVVCDRTAAWLHGADLLGPDGQHQVPDVQVFRTDGSDRLRRTGCAGGTRTLDPADVMRVDDIPATTPLRTALDLGRLIPRAQAIGAMDAMMRVGGFTVADLEAELPRFRGARWVTQLRGLVPLVDGRAESPAESLTRLRLIDAGLPRPEVQWEVYDELGRLVARLDLAYPDLRLAIEYDGAQFHSTPDQQAHDGHRRARLRRLGWTVVVLRAEHVFGPHTRAVRMVDAEIRRLRAGRGV